VSKLPVPDRPDAGAVAPLRRARRAIARDWRHLTALCVVMLACLATLSAGAVLKGDCFGHDNDYWRSRTCYNDIQPLYYDRGIDKGVFPYIHARLTSSGVGSHGFNEYPTLTGLFMWSAGEVVSSGSAYLLVTMALLGICGLVTAWALGKMVGRRGLYWAASPPLALYAFHNWDLLAVCAATIGLFAWRRDSPYRAAVAFGIGGAFKLYPALFIVPLVLEQVGRRRFRPGALVGLYGAAPLLVANLPFVIANPGGWWATYRFHEQRVPTSSGTIWAVAYRGISTTTENRLSALAVLATVLLFTVVFLRRGRRGDYPVLEWCAAITAALVVFNKVSSPQYVLWILPFFALVRVRHLPYLWVALCAIVTVRYGAEFGVGIFGWGTSTANEAAKAAVIGQAVVLVLYIVGILWTLRPPPLRAWGR
jgi:uncharacterized membrane protein